MFEISRATTPAQLDAVRGLMRAFVEWHGGRHGEYQSLLNQYFDPEKFEAELNGLPGEFIPPRGRLLVAADEGVAVGCVALRDLGGDVCEMKRLFVLSEFHGRGVGVALAKAVLEEARSIGYRLMRLDTGPKSIEAQAIYRKLGFKDIAPYYELDDQMKNWLVFMELTL
ncbi:GNAT superfamily N-acetyltransferase [Paraburkholderia terricola]|uniref:GNAT family N-acetyltransferase n=1 Tax=Paraburkholderia terricola TaxID=169427 RepID=UPI00285E90EF|nr:GNAT family N-acetyltransferase [Paraburkholderia terricola]MDR6495700.1 GNAT superfamily N-acetyltransferase [Paraburkholderia terricola]